MAVAYTVRANVVDLSTDNPLANDEFIVDTNAWFWTVYTKAALSSRPPTRRQLSAYPGYLSRVLAVGARLTTCCLTWAELAHIIERSEHDIYNSVLASQGQATVGPKEYRHNLPAERASVDAEIAAAWRQIRSMSALLDVTLDEPAVGRTTGNLGNVALDGYDLLLVDALTQAGKGHVITDDGDFATVSGLTVFTSNGAVLAAAKAQGHLVVR